MKRNVVLPPFARPRTRLTLMCGIVGLLALGCTATVDTAASPDGHEEPGSGTTTDPRDRGPAGDDAGGFEPGESCDIAAIFAKPAHDCTNAACHGAAKVGGLDLASPGLEARLRNSVSGSESCHGVPLIDAAHPDDSLLLRRIDPARQAAAPCGSLMPPGSTTGMAGADLACVTRWVRTIAEQSPDDDPALTGDCRDATFEAERVESYARKVKTLMTGAPLLASELDAVKSAPDALRTLISTWLDTDAFEIKARAFFDTALQQGASFGRFDSVSQVRASDAAANYFPTNGALQALRESMGRTAWHLVETGRPFTEIASTRRWMVTTSMLAYLLAADARVAGHRFFTNEPPPGVPLNPTLEEQIRLHAWKVPDTCPLRQGDGSVLLGFIMGGVRGCSSAATMTPDDSNDWREVELTTLAPGERRLEFWNVQALRDASRVALTVPRAGYFSQPAFLGQWRTNVDNSFRVITNQSLIVGLGQSFDDKDTTMPLSSEGLAAEHAGPGTQCYQCHKSLDPMRNFFKNVFNPDFYSPLPEPVFEQPSFGFFGVQAAGDDLVDFGAIIAGHPLFATAWTQKLCYFANSQACREDDPEFERVRDLFVASHFDFKTLIVELFSSPLVTGATATVTQRCNDFLVSITRRDHLCRSLEQRLGAPGICERAGDLVGALPSDSWARGAEEPFQPSSSSLFYAASMEALCSRLAELVVNEPGTPLQSRSMPAALDFLTTSVMDLSPSDPRYAAARADLATHVADAATVTPDKAAALKSAFVLACSSPFVTSLGL